MAIISKCSGSYRPHEAREVLRRDDPLASQLAAARQVLPVQLARFECAVVVRRQRLERRPQPRKREVLVLLNK